jgi:hypothetical protein
MRWIWETKTTGWSTVAWRSTRWSISRSYSPGSGGGVGSGGGSTEGVLLGLLRVSLRAV